MGDILRFMHNHSFSVQNFNYPPVFHVECSKSSGGKYRTEQNRVQLHDLFNAQIKIMFTTDNNTFFEPRSNSADKHRLNDVKMPSK